MSEAEQTQVATLARDLDLDLVVGERLHCVALIDCFYVGWRFVVGPLGVWIGGRLRP